MQLFYINTHLDIGLSLDLKDQEALHISKVLRKNVGDNINICNGEGVLFDAEILSVSKKKCSVKIISLIKKEVNDNFLTIAIAPTKNIARIEWFIEKVIEVGIQKIAFISCSHSERKVIKIDRLVSKGISAMKQSLNLFLPKMDDLVKFHTILKEAEETYEIKLIAYCDEKTSYFKSNVFDNKKTIILIGPEGGFTKKEVAQAELFGFKAVSLGKNRLRTETAGVFASCVYNSMINYN